MTAQGQVCSGRSVHAKSEAWMPREIRPPPGTLVLYKLHANLAATLAVLDAILVAAPADVRAAPVAVR